MSAVVPVDRSAVRVCDVMRVSLGPAEADSVGIADVSADGEVLLPTRHHGRYVECAAAYADGVTASSGNKISNARVVVSHPALFSATTRTCTPRSIRRSTTPIQRACGNDS